MTSVSPLQHVHKKGIFGDCEDNNEKNLCDLAASFQKTVADILCDRLENAMKLYEEKSFISKSLVVSGGVASNLTIREKIRNIASKNCFKSFFPPVNLCTDNAVMVAWAGNERFQNGYTNNLDFEAMSRWPLEDRKI